MFRRSPLIATLLIAQLRYCSGFWINPDYKMCSIQFVFQRMGMKALPGRFHSAQAIETAGGLMLQCRGQGGDSSINIVAFLLPAPLHRLVPRLVKNDL